MAANAFQAAQDIYDYAYGDPKRVAEVKAAYSTAVSAGLLTQRVQEPGQLPENGRADRAAANFRDANRNQGTG